MSSPAEAKFLHLRIAFWALLLAAVLVAVLPLPVPPAVRLAVAATDLIAASVVWLALRQARARPPQH